jgi:hypothetical protein
LLNFNLAFIKENSVANQTIDNNKNAMNKSGHETIAIKNRVPIKSIRVERDYSLGDGITRFYTEYPEDLQGRVRITNYAYTCTHIPHRLHQKYL